MHPVIKLRQLFTASYILILSLFNSSTALAAQGVPGVIEDLQSMKEQIASLQSMVSDLTTYIKANTASPGDAYSEICFNAKLGVLANGKMSVQGVNKAGQATGVDLYGLLDIDAGIEGISKAELASILESGVDVSVKMCMNAGVMHVVGVPRIPNEPVPATNELNELLDTTRASLLSVYTQFPGIASQLSIGPENIENGMSALSNTLASSAAFSTPRLLSSSAWSEQLEGLPGYAPLMDRYDAISNTFATMQADDICGYYAGLSGTLDAPVANVMNITCAAIPAGINTSLAAIANAVNDVHANTSETIPVISNIVNGNYSYLTGTISPLLNAVNSKVDYIKDSLP